MVYGVKPRFLHRIHQGDDVWISNGSRMWAAGLCQIMLDMGFVMQVSKQLFGVCVGEFLRVRSVEGEAMGYLMRAVCSLIMRPVQAPEIIPPADRAVGINSQLLLLSRSGMKELATTLLWKVMVPWSSQMKRPNGQVVCVKMALATRSRVDGGLGLCPPGSACAPSNRIEHFNL